MKAEVLSELEPIGRFKVKVIDNGRSVYIDVRDDQGRGLIVYDVNGLNDLRALADQHIYPDTPEEEAMAWRNSMVEMAITMREAWSPFWEDTLRPPWYIRLMAWFSKLIF